MPSFVVHSVIGNQFRNKLNLNEEDKKRFFVGNLLPDSKKISIDPNWDDVELRINIQKEKRITHFRSEIYGALEYPNMEIFLEKYENEVRKNIVSLAYMFHLYTDYYYFKYYLPSIVTFLDKNKNVIDRKDNEGYMKLNKTNILISSKEFWGKSSKTGLYYEYSVLNNYLMDKYNLEVDIDDLKTFLSKNDFYTSIEEVDSKNGLQVVDKLDSLLVESKNINEHLRIFDTQSVDEFINNVIDSFMDNYSYLLEDFL